MSFIFWGFPIEQQLYEAAHQVIKQIKSQTSLLNPSIHEEVSSIVLQLTEAGLEQYYQVPVQQVPIHPKAKRFADSGIRVVMGAINMVIRQFFKNRSNTEMLEIAAYLETMLWQHPHNAQAYLVFALDKSLYERAVVLIEQVRIEPNVENYIEEIIATLTALVEQGVFYYYQSPSDRVGLKGLTRRTVDLGIHNAQKGIRILINKLVRELSHQHLVSLSYHIESMIHTPFAFKSAS